MIKKYQVILGSDILEDYELNYHKLLKYLYKNYPEIIDDYEKEENFVTG
jgi:hypothetical protein